MSICTALFHFLGTAIASTVFISFGEMVLHRHLMHRQQLWGWLYRVLPDLRAQFKNHAVLHHGRYYKEFDHEPDPAGKIFNVRILWGDSLRLIITFSPVMAALWFLVSWVSALTFLLMLVGHNLLWGVVHMQMHVPVVDSWIGRTAYFRFISRHHFMHHRQTAKNYNVVVPLADFVIGRVARRKVSDVREMLRLGYLEPRQAASVARMARVRDEKLVERSVGLPLAAV
ncbi:MAG TPA: hypothetical protein VGB85_30365 [Nannocystis sp.]|jgi:hypothetical protein